VLYTASGDVHLAFHGVPLKLGRQLCARPRFARVSVICLLGALYLDVDASVSQQN